MRNNLETRKIISSDCTITHLLNTFSNSRIFFVKLPSLDKTDIKNISKNSKITKICEFVTHLSSFGKSGHNVIFFGSMYLLPYVYHAIDSKYKFRNLISVRCSSIEKTNFLPNEHMGLMFFSTHVNSLNHVRKSYQFCKCCHRTVKDYGGKEHLLDKKGTRISDVWTDITINPKEKFPKVILQRVLDLTKKTEKDKIHCIYLDIHALKKWNLPALPSNIVFKINPTKLMTKSKTSAPKKNIIFNSDVLIGLKKIPDNSIDLALVDPPYNISIRYGKFFDNMTSDNYLHWSQKWISEISRTLKPGGLFVFVNIPQWALELFPYIQKKLTFQSWIVWDAFSYPHTPVIPAHYPILCFSKGTKVRKHQKLVTNNTTDDLLNPLSYGYCIRSTCLRKRTIKMQNDKKPISDLWSDIHRIRHNSFRYSHPTLMPQKLAKRIITLFSKPGDTVLDCFNGVGTTTLIAKEMERQYIGIEKNQTYYKTSIYRHSLFKKGLNPFDKTRGKSTSKNKGYPIIKHQSTIPKVTLQLEVKKVAKKIGHCPSPLELKKYGQYSLKYYYDNFRDWAEITVATRRSGL